MDDHRYLNEAIKEAFSDGSVKPSNVLAAIRDGKLVPKWVDGRPMITVQALRDWHNGKPAGVSDRIDEETAVDEPAPDTMGIDNPQPEHSFPVASEEAKPAPKPKPKFKVR